MFRGASSDVREDHKAKKRVDSCSLGDFFSIGDGLLVQRLTPVQVVFTSSCGGFLLIATFKESKTDFELVSLVYNLEILNTVLTPFMAL